MINMGYPGEHLTDAQLYGIKEPRACTTADSRLSGSLQFRPLVDFDPKDPELPCRAIAWELGGTAVGSLHPIIPPKSCRAQKEAGLCPLEEYNLTLDQERAIQHFRRQNGESLNGRGY